MSLSPDRVRASALAHVTADERRACVVYLAVSPVRRGDVLSVPRLTLTVPWDGYVAFVDLDPTANWGHAACYLCIDGETGDVQRVNAQFPPFVPPTGDGGRAAWDVIYQAPGVPDALLAVPKG
jgi:hypothetical protein